MSEETNESENGVRDGDAGVDALPDNKGAFETDVDDVEATDTLAPPLFLDASGPRRGFEDLETAVPDEDDDADDVGTTGAGLKGGGGRTNRVDSPPPSGLLPLRTSVISPFKRARSRWSSSTARSNFSHRALEAASSARSKLSSALAIGRTDSVEREDASSVAARRRATRLRASKRNSDEVPFD